MASMSDNWRLDVKFQGRSIDLVGRLPAEKRALLREFPRRLTVGTKAKLAAIPPKGFFCKFFAKNCEEMKVYMKKHECALCVLRRERSNHCVALLLSVGASSDSIRSLCSDRDGVVIGFIVSEVNVEMEEKLHERMKGMQELESTAKAISHTFGDPMLEFDLLIDQLDTKPSAIQSSKARATIVYVVHDVIKGVRAGFPQKERNVKMRESALVLSLEKILFQLVQKLTEDAKHNPNIRAVLEFWTKWGLEYSVPVEEEDDAGSRYDPMLKIDETFEILEREVALVSDASSSPVKPTASPEVLSFMKTHSIQQGPWEVFLGRATTQELEELDAALNLNVEYFRFNHWNPSEKGGRRHGELLLHQYAKLIMPWLLHPSSTSKSAGKRKRAKDSLSLLRDAFLCTWDLDPAAERAVSDIERSVLDDIWKKMETEKCQNASAFVFGKVRRIKTIQFAKSPVTDVILKAIEDEAKVDISVLTAELVKVFKLDSMAREAVAKVKSKADLCYIAKEICHRCRHHMVANPSVHMVKLCQKAVAAKNPMKAYSSAMKSMMSRQMKMSAMFDKEAQKKRKLESSPSSPTTETEASNSPHAELTDAELAAVKRRIPKPPKLLFKKVDLKTITYQE
ncbi:hypothetical protein BBJ28_00024686, partial [Nothophytophthora sp. Chile5]